MLCTGFSLLEVSWRCSRAVMHTLLLQWLLLLWNAGSGAHGISVATACRLGSCGTRAQPLLGMWDPPGAGIAPSCPALADGFSTAGPLPGKPQALALRSSLTGFPSWLCQPCGTDQATFPPRKSPDVQRNTIFWLVRTYVKDLQLFLAHGGQLR